MAYTHPGPRRLDIASFVFSDRMFLKAEGSLDEDSSVPRRRSWCPGGPLVVDLPAGDVVGISHLEEARCVPGEGLIMSS